VSGGVASTFAPAAVVSTGSVGNSPISGAMSVVLGAASASATATVYVTGTCDALLDASGAAGAGWATATGAAGAELAPASLAASGAVAGGEPAPEPIPDAPPADTRTASVAGESRDASVPPSPRTADAE
jgi:hypothetical protein